LTGKLVLDWGAGTGIASRQLAERGATVISLDIGEQMLRRALARSPGSACVLGDGNQMPIRSASADVVTFAQSWHWFDHRVAAAESNTERAVGWAGGMNTILAGLQAQPHGALQAGAGSLPGVPEDGNDQRPGDRGERQVEASDGR
jgi:SAM-dependent methyltransferase